MTSSFRALTIQSGITTQVGNSTTLLVGQGIDTNAAGPLGLGLSSGGFATSITLNQPTSVTGANTFTVGTGLASFGGGLTVTAGATTLDGGLAVTGGTASDTLTVSGATTLSSFATAGVVHNAAGGLLSSSLIVDADVSSSAAIAVSKLAHGTDAQFLFSTASATVWATMSQDGYLADTGVLTVVSAHGNFAVGGNETVAGTLAVTGNTNLSTLATSGAATLNSLVVTTTSALDGYVTASAGVGVAGGLTVSGGTSTDTFAASGNATVGGTLGVSGDATFSGAGTGLAVTNNATVGGTFAVTGTSALTGTVTTTNGVVVGTTLSTGGLATLNSASVTTTLGVTGAATLGSTLAVTGVSTLTGGVLTPSVDSISGALSLGTANASAVTIGKTGITTTVDGYLSISTLTSGLVYATSGVLSTGGAASLPVADLDPGTPGQVLMTNGSTVTAWETFSQDATVTGSGVVTVLSSNGNFTVGGSGTGNLTVNGTSTLHGNTSVTDAYTFSVGTGATTLGGTLAVTGTSTFTGEATFNAATGVNVTSAATVGTTLTVGTGLTVTSGGATIGGNSTVTGTFHVTSTSNLDGYVTAGAGVGVTGNVTASGNGSFGGTLAVTGLTTLSGGLTSAGTTTLSALTPQGIVVNSSSGVLSTSVGTDKQILLTNSSLLPVWVTVNGDGYINTDTGTLIVTQAAGNFTVDGNLTVDGTSSLVGAVTTTAGVSVGTTLSVGSTSTFAGLLTANGGVATTTLGATGAATLSGGAAVTGGLTTDTLMTSGSATVTGTLGVTGNTSLTTLSTSGLATLNSASVTNNLLVGGNFQVNGTETIVGTSVFMNPATFDNTVTVADGYSLITDSITSAGSDVLNINGAGGFNLKVNGSTVVDGYSTSVVYIPAGVTLEAQAGGQIIATSSSGTTALTVPFTTTGVSTGAAVYVSSSDTVTATIATAIGTSYCVGFVSSAGFVSTDGLVTPIITGSASAGQAMYLDPANAGQVTNVAPTTVGQVVAPVGYMKNAAQMIVRVLTPVQL